MSVKILKAIGITLVIVIIALSLYAYHNVRDRHRGYHIDLKIENKGPGVMQAGFAAVTITPEYLEPWNDVDSNARYEPDKGEWRRPERERKFDTTGSPDLTTR